MRTGTSEELRGSCGSRSCMRLPLLTVAVTTSCLSLAAGFRPPLHLLRLPSHPALARADPWTTRNRPPSRSRSLALSRGAQRFWTEVHDGAKLFYLSGRHQEYRRGLRSLPSAVAPRASGGEALAGPQEPAHMPVGKPRGRAGGVTEGGGADNDAVKDAGGDGGDGAVGGGSSKKRAHPEVKTEPLEDEGGGGASGGSSEVLVSTAKPLFSLYYSQA